MGWLFIGLLIGAVVVFLLMLQQVSQQAKTLKKHRMRLEQMERDSQNRMRSATLKLQEECGRRLAEQKSSYERQLTEQKARLQTEFNQQTAALEQKYAAQLGLQAPALDFSEQTAAKQGEDTPSSLPTRLAPPEAAAIAAAAATPPPPAVPEPEAPQVPPTPIVPVPAQKPLTSGFTAAAQPLIPKLALPLQAEAPLGDLATASQQANPSDRKQVATALGQFVMGNKRAPAQRSLPILRKLIQDPDPSVRKAAVEALGGMSSVKVIPLLKRALRDTDSDVVQTASAALSKFKGASSKTSPSKPRKKLPKNR